MKALTQVEIVSVYGGDGGAPATPANAVGEAVIIGAMSTIALGAATGSPVGPVGMIIGGVTAGILTAVGSNIGGGGRQCRIHAGYQFCD